MAKNKSLGGIVIDMILRDEKFVAGMKRAGKVMSLQVAKMRKDLNSLATSNLTKLGAAIGGAGIAAGLYTATQNLGDLADEATRLGVSANSLVAFRHAAKLAGIETEEIDKSLKGMNKAVFEADTGNTALANTFEKLGLNVSELMTMSPEKRYALITEKINGLNNATERASVSMDIFGKTGHAMQSLISGGAEEIANAREEADLLGLTMDRIDLAKVQLAGDNLDRLQLAGKGFMEQLAMQFAPLINELSERILKFVSNMGGMGAVAEKTFGGIIKGAGLVGDVLRGWELIIAGLNITWKTLGLGITGIVGTIMSFVQTSLNTGVRSINLFIKAYNKLPINEKAKEITFFKFADSGVVAAEIETANKELDGAIGDFNKIIDKGKPSTEWPKLVEDLNTKWTEVAKPIAEAADAAQTFQDITITAAEKADKSLKKTEKTIKAIKGDFLSFAEIADKGGNGLNARLAKRANSLRDRAEGEEAKGNFQAADRLRSRAAELESRVKRREVFTPAQEAEKAKKDANLVANAEAATKSKGIDLPRGEKGSIDNPYSSFEEAKKAEAAAIEAEKKRQRDIEYAKVGDRMGGTRKPGETYDEINERMHKGFNPGVDKSEVANDKAASEAAKSAGEEASGKGGGLIEEIQNLIKTLTELPNRLGVA